MSLFQSKSAWWALSLMLAAASARAQSAPAPPSATYPEQPAPAQQPAGQPPAPVQQGQPPAPAQQPAAQAPLPAYPEQAAPALDAAQPAYPAPGYSQPPPPGLRLPYPAAADRYPAAPPVAPLPEDAAVHYNPFLDVIVGGALLNRRFDTGFAPGVEFGGFFGERFRIALRAQSPLTEPGDRFSADTDGDLLDGGFAARPSGDVTLIFGGSVGVVALATRGFVLSPGVTVLRTDVSDYGTALGFGLPVMWVARSGMRVGFDMGVVYGIGGTVVGECSNLVPAGQTQNCAPGTTREFDRDNAAGFYAGFRIGWGLSEPSRGAGSPNLPATARNAAP